jgi:hypothetical protein
MFGDGDTTYSGGGGIVEWPDDASLVPERVKLKFSVKVSGLIV